jgi:ABC-2 type transport system ATP-binding protein
MSVVLAAFHSPDVLLLDEPFDGVDPLGVEATMQVIQELAAAGGPPSGLHAPARPRRAGLRGGDRAARGRVCPPRRGRAGRCAGAARYRSLLS